MDLSKDAKEIVFICIPRYVGIRGNSAADSAAKDAFDGNRWAHPLHRLKV